MPHSSVAELVQAKTEEVASHAGDPFPKPSIPFWNDPTHQVLGDPCVYNNESDAVFADGIQPGDALSTLAVQTDRVARHEVPAFQVDDHEALPIIGGAPVRFDLSVTAPLRKRFARSTSPVEHGRPETTLGVLPALDAGTMAEL